MLTCSDSAGFQSLLLQLSEEVPKTVGLVREVAIGAVWRERVELPSWYAAVADRVCHPHFSVGAAKKRGKRDAASGEVAR